MNTTKLTAIALILVFSACGNRNNSSSSDTDTTSVNKQVADTFKTDSNSSTNGPDNARPVDTGGNDINYAKSPTSSGTGNNVKKNKSANSADNTSGAKNVNNARADSSRY